MRPILIGLICSSLASTATAVGQAGPVDPARAASPEVRQLREAGPWRTRVAAARRLAEVDWRRHPEVVLELARSLESDPDWHVRARSAESLGMMRALAAPAHVALAKASESDPRKQVRAEARSAIEARGKRCEGDCPICGPLPNDPIIVGPIIKLPELARPARKAAASTLPPALPDEP